MNELIEKLHDLLDKQENINVALGIERAINLVESLERNEPQEPVVPEFVAEYLNYCIGQEWTLSTALNAYDNKLIGTMHQAAMWLDDTMNQNTFAHAWLFGYEVEKEPLYMVPLLTDKEGNKKILVERRGQYDIIWDYENEGDWHELLTEEQIKSVNPDYWKLAVLYEPSEEVA